MAISKGRALSATVNSATSLIKSSIDGTVTTATIEQSAQQYANAAALPSVGNTFGEMALVQSTNRMYVWNGSGWYNVALINTNPTFTTSPAASYEFDGDSPRNNITITVAASDPESLGVSFSFETGGSMDSMASVTQDSSVFTLVPKGNDSLIDGVTLTGSLTIKATDGVNIVPAVSSFTLTFVTFISHSNKTSLLLKATGTGNNTTPTDASTSSHSLVMNGATASLGTFSPYKATGYSMHFDGSSDYISYPSHADFQFGTGDFTLEAWVYPTSIPGGGVNNDMTIFGHFGSPTMFFYLSNDTLQPVLWNGSTGHGSSLTAKLNGWTHIAFVRQSSTLKTYVNGQLGGTTNSYTTNFNASTAPYTGKSNSNSTRYFDGYIADLRVVKGTAVYTANFTPPTERLTAVTNTKLLMGAPGFYDKSAGRHLISVNGNSYIDSLSPYDLSSTYSASVHGGSATFPGTSDEIKTSDGSSNTIGLGSGDFTVETWIYKNNAANSTWEALISQKYGSTGGWRIYKSTSSGQVRWYAGSTDTLLSNTNNQLKQKAWCHVAMVRSSGTLTWYINGRASGTTSSHTYNYTGGGAEVEIGKGTVGSTYPTDANMTDVRIVNGTAVYTGDFTPPSGPLTTTGGTYPSTTNVNTSIPSGHTKLLLNMTQSKILDHSQHHTMHLTGAVPSSTQQHFSENTLYIEDGDADFVEISEEQTKKLTIYDDDYTVETWLYPTNFNGSYNYFISKGTSPSAREWAFSISASDIKVYWSTNGSSSGDTTITGTVSNSLNQWVNLTFTKVGNNVSIYKNGTHITSGAFNSIYSGDAKLTIGRLWQYTGISHSYDGYIHDLRITKGATHYPFIPAKQTLTTTNSQRSGVTVTASNVTLLTCHAATITDGSSNSTSITTNGNAVVSDFAPATGMKSVFFDGTGDYLQCTLADTLGTADWTVEYWVYHNSISGNQIHCAFNGYAPAFYRRDASNAFAVYHNPGISGNHNANITPVAGRWYHMAYCHDDSENKMTVFVDGALADEFAYTGNINGTTFRIGDDGTSAWMNGYISNLRIVKNTVVYSKTFTPATTALKG